MTTPTTGAAELPEALRLAAYVARRKKAKQVDQQDIHTFDAGHETEAVLLLSDIEALLAHVSALSAAQAGVPDGYVLAPLEPTVHQEAAGRDASIRCSTLGEACKIYKAMLAAAPTPPAQAADSVLEDAARMDWLDQQCEAYGFQDIHEGNRWEISGPYANVREAIDAERAARKQGGAT